MHTSYAVKPESNVRYNDISVQRLDFVQVLYVISTHNNVTFIIKKAGKSHVHNNRETNNWNNVVLNRKAYNLLISSKLSTS